MFCYWPPSVPHNQPLTMFHLLCHDLKSANGSFTLSTLFSKITANVPSSFPNWKFGIGCLAISSSLLANVSSSSKFLTAVTTTLTSLISSTKDSNSLFISTPHSPFNSAIASCSSFDKDSNGWFNNLGSISKYLKDWCL